MTKMESEDLSDICAKMIRNGETSHKLADGTEITIKKVEQTGVYSESMRNWG